METPDPQTRLRPSVRQLIGGACLLLALALNACGGDAVTSTAPTTASEHTAAPTTTSETADAPDAAAEETVETDDEMPAEDLSAEEVYSRVAPSIPLVETPTAIGSGVLVEGGYVVTNYHVVWPFDAAWVVFPDGPELRGVPVVGWDPLVDLAVLGPVDVSAQPLELEDGEDMSPGSEMFLVGYPAEPDPYPEPSITQGILSRVREWTPAGMTYLQSDTAIAGGQSGGALVDSQARVVGISTYSWSEAGFTVSTSAADDASIVQRLIEDSDDARLSDRRLGDEGGRSHEVRLVNLWDTATFVFEPSAGALHEFSIDGPKDGLFRVLDSLGVLLEVDDNFSGLEQRSVETSTDGIHFLQIENLSEGPAAFSVESTVALRPLEDPDDGQRIVVGERITGVLDFFSDSDWYSIRLQEGDTVSITTDSVSVDTLMYVAFPGSGTDGLVFDDDSGPAGVFGDQLNSQIVYRAPFTGEFFIVVTDALGEGLGGYLLSVEQAPAGAEAATMPSDDEALDSAAGEMTLFEDPDGYFQVELPAFYDVLEPLEPEPGQTYEEILSMSSPDATTYVSIYREDLLKLDMDDRQAIHEYGDYLVSVYQEFNADYTVEANNVLPSLYDADVQVIEFTDGIDYIFSLSFLTEDDLAFEIVYVTPYDQAGQTTELAANSVLTLQIY